MKLAVLCESSADEAALRILVDGILGQPTQAVALDQFRTRRGWTSVRADLPTVLRQVHYHTDADGLAVVLDSDRSPPHDVAHEAPNKSDPHCRLCSLKAITVRTQSQLRPVANRSPVKVAIGMAVPTVEAWFRCGVDPQVTEAAWKVALASVLVRRPPAEASRLRYGRPAASARHAADDGGGDPFVRHVG
jgi:hypothetical protein